VEHIHEFEKQYMKRLTLQKILVKLEEKYDY